MYFFTHLYVANVLYHRFAEMVPLDKQSFRYGNIKPDLPSLQRKNHTLQNYLSEACCYTQKMIEEDMDEKEFSVALGIVCHFLCDFFCYYHLNDEIHDRKVKHFIYEVSLHITLLNMDRRKFRSVLLGGREPGKELSELVAEQRRSYLSQPHCMKNDIRFAFITAIWACESIIYYKKCSSYIIQEEEAALGGLLSTEW